MNDAILNLSLGEYPLNSGGESGQIVRAGDENIFYRVYPEFCVKSELRHKIERKYMVREGGLSGLPCPQYKRKAECMSRAAAPDAVHFTLDMQAVFCYSGIRSPKKIAIWA